MSLTRAIVATALTDLAKIYAMPKHWPKNLDELVDRFLFVLNERPAVQAEQLQAAVREYLKADIAYFPKPGTLRQLALRQRRTSERSGTEASYWAWERSGYGMREDGTVAPCPICDVMPGACGPARRYGVVHIARRHREARVPFTGWSDEDPVIPMAPPAPAAVAAD